MSPEMAPSFPSSPLSSTSKTTEPKSRLVLGGASLNGLTKSEVFDLLDCAQSFGVSEIDTAPTYGTSEYLIGAYNRINPGLAINTKVGRVVENTSKSISITDQLSRSMELLNCSFLNNVFIHSLPPRQWREQGFLENLRLAQNSGLMKGVGYSGDNSDLLESKDELFDTYMFTYNYMDRSNTPFFLNDSSTKQIYLKRVLANAPWNMPASSKIKYFLGMRLLKKQMLDNQSYEFRYLQMKRDSNFQKLNLRTFLKFALAAVGNNSKIIVGVSKIRHLEQLIKIEAEINIINSPTEFGSWQKFQKEHKWKAII
jgi:aryl-alcohol dehydrogenase-like predicted oxidoreductase